MSIWERISVLLFLSSVSHRCVQALDFSYNGNTAKYAQRIGPTAWSEEYSSCKGKHQSPIDIDMLHVKKVKLPPLNLHNFEKPPNATQIENNGHTVYFTIEPDYDVPSISGGPFKGPYEFSQLHYHWGENDSYGSEDAFNGKHFPMELHVVFFKKEYESMKNATSYSDGLAVMAFFFKIANPNPAYEELSELLATITKPHTSASFKQPLALQDFMLPSMHEYYVYNGSLTTPPCLEVVTWLDFYDPIEISHDQLARFRSLEDSDGDTLSHNFRPVQPIGDRTVWFTSDNISDNDENLHTEIHGTKKKRKPKKKPFWEKSSAQMMQVDAIIIGALCTLQFAFIMKTTA